MCWIIKCHKFTHFIAQWAVSCGKKSFTNSVPDVAILALRRAFPIRRPGLLQRLDQKRDVCPASPGTQDVPNPGGLALGVWNILLVCRHTGIQLAHSVLHPARNKGHGPGDDPELLYAIQDSFLRRSWDRKWKIWCTIDAQVARKSWPGKIKNLFKM